MSYLKNQIGQKNLKECVYNLLEKVNESKNVGAKPIIEKYYGALCTLLLIEGKSIDSVYSELTNAGLSDLTSKSIISNSDSVSKKLNKADQVLIKQVDIFENLVKELKIYDWDTNINTFINESNDFLKQYRTHILVEQVLYDLELDKNNTYYTKAIDKLREVSGFQNPVPYILEKLESEKWIPLVNQLYSYTTNISGSINNTNPNFSISKIYSPVQKINESFIFYNSGKVFETDGKNSLKETGLDTSHEFKSLINIVKIANISENKIKYYPNTNALVELNIDEQLNKQVKLNNNIINENEIINHLVNGRYIRLNETQKISNVEQIVRMGEKIKEIDFGYKVTSKIYEGVSVSIFTLDKSIYVQRTNENLKINDIKSFDKAEDAINYVKEQLNYDITDSVKTLLETEEREKVYKQGEINRIQGIINELYSTLNTIDLTVRSKGLIENDKILEAKDLLKTEILKNKLEIRNLNGVNEAIEDLIDAKITKSYKSFRTNDIVQIDALEYTEKGNNEMITAHFKNKTELIPRSNISVEI